MIANNGMIANNVMEHDSMEQWSMEQREHDSEQWNRNFLFSRQSYCYLFTRTVISGPNLVPPEQENVTS